MKFKSLAVNAKGEAVVTYMRSGGKVRHVLAWGAINANAPVDPAVEAGPVQVGLRRRLGQVPQRVVLEARSRTPARPYDGPELPYLVAACKAPDGTYWALQSWQRGLPLLGFDPWKPAQTAFELHLSHWSGDLPKLEVVRPLDVRRLLAGPLRPAQLSRPARPRLRLDGRRQPARPLRPQRLHRHVQLRLRRRLAARVGILAHTPTGTFCHSFVPQKPFPGYPSQDMRPPAPGEKYRVTVMGPGVTPVVAWEGRGLTSADRASAASITAVFDEIMAGDARCAAER